VIQTEILIGKGPDQFTIAYDPEKNIVTIDGVDCSPMILRMMICEPDQSKLLRCWREGNTTFYDVIVMEKSDA
jgi:hypothetical protein